MGGKRTVPAALLPRLRLARDHIDRHYQSDLDLDRLAAVAGISKFYFIRCFEAAYGETPNRYVLRRRLERAQDLLRYANLTVTEICMAVGFTSLGSFSAKFHRMVGESPSAYRDRWAAHGAPRVPGCYLFMAGVLDPSRNVAPEAGADGREGGGAGEVDPAGQGPADEGRDCAILEKPQFSEVG
ncbi:transcriptional regulator [Sphaerisporangium melleum]|uniref:Transcriptional regulator n=1 Tax=Sphaerisporangium melleum TaxID=321316 RepID=A0A917R9C9_9ACTN|nr:AraC family transcriptional regulator [Sphaerisporangium melleum]GGK96653.1 transcriptional regulator [Sphaerisporangium melleum]GII71020.1 transcriptional regulator [Sphaerisporangium melleum]